MGKRRGGVVPDAGIGAGDDGDPAALVRYVGGAPFIV
jgi:hypothetical protein